MGRQDDSDEPRAAKPAPVTKISPWDNQSMKKMFDETLGRLLGEAPELVEDTRLVYGKMIIMLLSVACGAIAQFYPLPFPQNRLILILCSISYFILSGVLQYIVIFVEKESIYRCKSTKTTTETVVRSKNPKYSDKLTITIESPANNVVLVHETSSGKFFTESGTFSEEEVVALMNKTIKPIMLKKSS
jgi:Microsomal signal peptidase 25 kDa subunit (SPC25)